MRIFFRHFLCVLFFLTSLAPEAYCTRFIGLKIDKIRENGKSNPQAFEEVSIEHFYELLAGYQPSPYTEEEIDITFKKNISEAKSSDTDTDSEGIEAIAAVKLGNKRKTYNYSRKKYKGKPIQNYLEALPHATANSSLKERSKALCRDLACDALAIIEENTNMQTRNSTVCLCVVLKNSSGNGKKFVFHNGHRGLPGPMGNKAHNLHYHIVNAEQAHAEGEFIQFLLDRGKKTRKGTRIYWVWDVANNTAKSVTAYFNFFWGMVIPNSQLH